MNRNSATLLIVGGVVLGMVGLSFAAVPLYDMFCRVTGFGGTTQTAEALPERTVDRPMRVRFNTDVDKRLPWAFSVDTKSVTVRPGAPGFVAFKAVNESEKPIVGTAIYNVVPQKAGQYFHKIQCFCFNKQVLKPGQKQNFPVYFYLDPALADDPAMDDVDTITLSYTFFASASQEMAQAAESYNATVEAVEREAGESGAYARKSVAEEERQSGY